jgi:hypothetical protein
VYITLFKIELILKIAHFKNQPIIICFRYHPPIQHETHQRHDGRCQKVRKKESAKTNPTTENGNNLRLPRHARGHIDNSNKYGDRGKESGNPNDKIEIVI